MSKCYFEEQHCHFKNEASLEVIEVRVPKGTKKTVIPLHW